MPALPNNKQETRREVFVSLVQSPVGVQIERNWYKLIVVTLRFVIIRPALSLDRRSECNYLIQ